MKYLHLDKLRSYSVNLQNDDHTKDKAYLFASSLPTSMINSFLSLATVPGQMDSLPLGSSMTVQCLTNNPSIQQQDDWKLQTIKQSGSRPLHSYLIPLQPTREILQALSPLTRIY